MSTGPRVAVACSGLGHIQRGIESWAFDLAQALRRAGVDVTLFGAKPAAVGDVIGLPALYRERSAAQSIAKLARHLGGWRYGLGSPYDVEQTRFACALWRRVRRDFDIIHVQDPTIAIWMDRAYRRRLSRAAVVYANGTGEGASVMRRFRYVQLLTGSAAHAWMSQAPTEQKLFTIPNFIDTDRFCPGDQTAARARFDLPRDRMIVLCCAAIRRYHKRIDSLLNEFASMRRATGRDAMLVIAGGRESDTDTLITEGKQLLGDAVRFLPDLRRDAMPDLYRSADVCVLASLHEMFGIVLLEALATGLPVLCNDTPDFRAIVGPAGLHRDLSKDGALSSGLTSLLDLSVRTPLAAAARSHVEAHFSEARVIQQILAMYQSVQADHA